MTDDIRYREAADWAEHHMEIVPDSTTALRGDDASTYGTDLIQRARRAIHAALGKCSVLNCPHPAVVYQMFVDPNDNQAEVPVCAHHDGLRDLTDNPLPRNPGGAEYTD